MENIFKNIVSRSDLNLIRINESICLLEKQLISQLLINYESQIGHGASMGNTSENIYVTFHLNPSHINGALVFFSKSA